MQPFGFSDFTWRATAKDVLERKIYLPAGTLVVADYGRSGVIPHGAPSTAHSAVPSQATTPGEAGAASQKRYRIGILLTPPTEKLGGNGRRVLVLHVALLYSFSQDFDACLAAAIDPERMVRDLLLPIVAVPTASIDLTTQPNLCRALDGFAPPSAPLQVVNGTNQRVGNERPGWAVGCDEERELEENAQLRLILPSNHATRPRIVPGALTPTWTPKTHHLASSSLSQLMTTISTLFPAPLATSCSLPFVSGSPLALGRPQAQAQAGAPSGSSGDGGGRFKGGHNVGATGEMGHFSMNGELAWEEEEEEEEEEEASLAERADPVGEQEGRDSEEDRAEEEHFRRSCEEEAQVGCSALSWRERLAEWRLSVSVG